MGYYQDKIFWTHGEVDEAYTFALPGYDSGCGEVFYHCKRPSNEGGIGESAEQFGYIPELIANHRVEKIIFREQIYYGK